MTTVPLDRFETMYAGGAPWDIGRPQKNFVEVADRITGSLLDAGCGTGDNALFFAERGCRVVGFDFLEEPIRRAKEKAAEKKIDATFLVKDALTLKDWDKGTDYPPFDYAIDSGLFHVFNDADAKTYVDGQAHVLKPGGRLFLLCFSDEEPGTDGPHRISKQMLYDRFRVGWAVESIIPTRFEVRPEQEGVRFSPGGPKAWFVILRKA
jgi:SAM-dependent methyltransferase